LPVIRALMAFCAAAVTTVWTVAAIHRFRGDLCFLGRCSAKDVWLPAGTVAWRAPLALGALVLGVLALQHFGRSAAKR